jgi:nucleotide-binding universal stress UspA family protein
MKITNILCPVDFSKPSEAAIAHASALARRHGARLHFVYVYEPTFADGYMMGMPTQPPPADLEPLCGRLKALHPTGDDDVECRHELIFGFPGASLIGYAATNDIDLIVMGTHGRTGPSRLLMGSVAEAVVRSASCPVLTVHEANSAIV